MLSPSSDPASNEPGGSQDAPADPASATSGSAAALAAAEEMMCLAVARAAVNAAEGIRADAEQQDLEVRAELSRVAALLERARVAEEARERAAAALDR